MSFGIPVRNGLGLGLLASTSLSTFNSGFTPLSLFAANEPGAWYDPSDFVPNWRRNLLTYTEQFDNAVWQKGNMDVNANSTTAPNGTTTADTLTPNMTGGVSHSITQNVSVSGLVTRTVYAKSNGYNFIALTLNNNSAIAAWFNLSTLQVSQIGASVTATSITDVGGGWRRLSLTASATVILVQDYVAPSASFGPYAGDGTSGIYLWGAQLEVGSTASAYQQIVTPEITYVSTIQSQPVMFTDAAGTTPVTAVEQPVGLMLDKSKGLVLGPELVTNGDFSNGTTGWTANNGAVISAVSGGLQVATGLANQGASQSFATVSGRRYQVSVTVVSATASYNIGYGNVFGQGQVYDSGSLSGARTFTASFVSNGTSTVFWLYAQAAGTFIFDNISVRELPGNHLTQSTTTARPVLSARYNLLTQTEAFNEAVWLKPGGWLTVNSNADIAPDGTQTADKLIPRANADPYHNATRVTTCGASVHIQSYYVKAAGYNKVGIREDGVVGQWATFLLSGAGSVIAKHASATASITALENSWYRVTLTPSTASANMGTGIYVLDNNYTSGAPDAYTFAGDGTSGVLAWGADFRPVNDGVDLPAYQRVGAATYGSSSSAGSADYDTTGFPLYLRFDGTDDFMVSSTITPGIDKAQVFAGVRKLTTATFPMIAEMGVNADTLPAINLYSNSTDDKFTFNSRGSGSVATSAAATASIPPASAVLTGIGSISEDISQIRVNGVFGVLSTTDQGSGNYSPYPLYVGARGGTSLWFNGRVYGLTVRFGANLSATQITDMETWLNNKTKAF